MVSASQEHGRSQGCVVLAMGFHGNGRPGTWGEQTGGEPLLGL